MDKKLEAEAKEALNIIVTAAKLKLALPDNPRIAAAALSLAIMAKTNKDLPLAHRFIESVMGQFESANTLLDKIPETLKRTK